MQEEGGDAGSSSPECSAPDSPPLPLHLALSSEDYEERGAAESGTSGGLEEEEVLEEEVLVEEKEAAIEDEDEDEEEEFHEATMMHHKKKRRRSRADEVQRLMEEAFEGGRYKQMGKTAIKLDESDALASGWKAVVKYGYARATRHSHGESGNR